MEIMVDYLTYYSPVLSRAVAICNELVTFFTAEQSSASDRFAQAATETRTFRNGLLQRMETPKYLAPVAFGDSTITGFMAFYDNHATNDYGVALSPEKLAIRDHLLAAWIADVVEPLVQLMNQAEKQAKEQAR